MADTAPGTKVVGLIVLLCFLPALTLGPVFFGAVHIVWASIVQSLVIAGFAAVLLRVLISGRRLIRDPLDVALLLCWAYITVRYVASDHEYQSRQEWLLASAAFWLYFSLRSLRSQQWLPRVLGAALLIVAAGISGYTLYQKFGDLERVLWLPAAYPGRVSGTYYCPNHLAGFLEMFIPLLLSGLLFLRLSIAWRLATAYVVLMMTAAHLYTLSRGGVLSLAAGCAVVFFLGWRSKPAALSILGIAGAMGSLAYAYVLRATEMFGYERFTTALHHGEWSRLEMWKSALLLWERAPWFGYGPMQFEWLHASVRGGVPARAVYVHNDYLQLLVDYGIVGAVFFAAFLALALAKLLFGCRRYELLRTTYHHPHVVLAPEESFRRAAFIGVAGALTALFLHSVVDFNLHLQANALIFAFLMAVGHNLCEDESDTLDAEPAVRLLQRALAVGLLAVCIWQGVLIWKNAQSDRFLRMAQTSQRQMDWERAGAFYQRAIAADEVNSDAWSRYTSFLYQRALLDVEKRAAYQAEFLDASKRALELNPLNKILRIRRGEILDRMGQFEQAEKEYLDAVSFDPQNAFFQNKFGLHYKKRGMSAQAQEYFQRAAKLPGGTLTADINLRILGPIKEQN